MSRVSYKLHADALARELWRVGCCTPGLADRLLKKCVPQDAEHAPLCPLASYLRDIHPRRTL